MPPKNVKTVRDLIYWEYAKLIAGSAVGNRKNYGFVMHTYQKLKNGKLSPSQILKENKMLVESEKCCAYCDTKGELEWEHIIPKAEGGKDEMDNMVLACRKCNAQKQDKCIFEWYGLDKKYEVPRLVLGKYLKLAFDKHKEAGTLDESDINGDGKLDVLDIDAIFHKKT